MSTGTAYTYAQKMRMHLRRTFAHSHSYATAHHHLAFDSTTLHAAVLWSVSLK